VSNSPLPPLLLALTVQLLPSVDGIRHDAGCVEMVQRVRRVLRPAVRLNCGSVYVTDHPQAVGHGPDRKRV
jgi:hypothetical protein